MHAECPCLGTKYTLRCENVVNCFMQRCQVLRQMKRVVLQNAGSELVSLYVIGSFLTNEMIRSSDIDLVGIMKSSFDFRKEARINKALNETVSSGHRIDLGIMSYDEFFGGTRKGSLTKHIELPIFLNFLNRAQLVCGKRINFDKLPIKPASPEQELKYHIGTFDEYKTVFRKSDNVGSDFSFRDFIKTVFYIADLELQLGRSLPPRRSYSEIVKAFRNERAHIVNYSMKLRRKKSITHKEKQSWLDSAERYVARMKTGFATELDSIPMKREIVADPSELAAAWSRQYERLAQTFADVLGKKNRKIAEIGCGSGQLTIPLAKHAAKAQFALVDRYGGSAYSQNYEALRSNLKKAKLTGRARVGVSDYLKWIATQGDGVYDAVISSEFLPEIDSADTSRFIQECYRIMRSGGVTAHSFLSPVPRNSGQKLLIMADSNPIWTKKPPKEWFSPEPALVTSELRKSGFHGIRKTAKRSYLIMKAEAARCWLKAGEVKASFYEKHKTQLNKDGL